jgi:hypothetical protein
MNTMNLAVVGSRSFRDKARMFSVLDALRPEIKSIISGGAQGADCMAEEWAKERGVPFQSFPADWATYGKMAGFLRNVDMVLAADAVLAFWDGWSRGTRHTIELAEKRKKPVTIIRFTKGSQPPKDQACK